MGRITDFDAQGIKGILLRFAKNNQFRLENPKFAVVPQLLRLRKKLFVLEPNVWYLVCAIKTTRKSCSKRDLPYLLIFNFSDGEVYPLEVLPTHLPDYQNLQDNLKWQDKKYEIIYDSLSGQDNFEKFKQL